MAIFQLNMRRCRIQKSQFLGQELGAFLHRIALQAFIDKLVIAVQQVKLELWRAISDKSHIRRPLGDAAESVTRVASNRRSIGPDNCAHDLRRAAFMAQQAQG